MFTVDSVIMALVDFWFALVAALVTPAFDVIAMPYENLLRTVLGDILNLFV